MAAKRSSNGRRGRARLAEEELSPEEWELVDFIEQVGPAISRVYIWRVPKFGDHEYLDRVEVSLLKDGAEEFLRETYGAPCKYYLRFKGSDGLWKFSKMISVGSLDKTAFQDSLSGSPSRGLSSGPSAAEMEFKKELAMMQARQHETYMGIIANLGKQTGPDPAAMFTAVVTGFTAMREATNTKTGEFDLAKFREIVGVVNDLRGEAAAKEENVYTVVKDLGNKVVETVSAWRQPAALPVGTSEAAAVEQVRPNGGARAMPSVQDWVKMQLQYLKQKALAGKDPEAWIDYILDNEEEPGCGAILYALKQKVTFEQLLQFDPDIAQNPALQTWFKTVYDGLLSEINQPVDSTGGTGNPGNPRGNEAVSHTGSPGPDTKEPSKPVN
jgi:hypothetical protein